MSNFSDFFPAPGGGGGGGGGIPKYQEFITSGTFTPSQALIDAGGRIGLFIVGGGGGGTAAISTVATGGAGGEVLMQYITLTNTNAITVTIASGGATYASGGNTTFAASSAGGTDVVALGGTFGAENNSTKVNDRLTAGFGAVQGENAASGSAGSGVLGYGAGGSTYQQPGVGRPKNNSGSGGGRNRAGGSGFVRLTWFE